MRRAAKNFVAGITGDVARRFLGFLALPFIARRGGADGFGMINLALTILTYGIMISSAGMQLLGTRAVAAGRKTDFIGELAGGRLVLAAGVYLCIALSMLFVQNTMQAVLILIVTLGVFPNAVFLDWYFQGREQMGFIVLARLLSAVVYFLATVLFMHGFQDLVWVALGAMLGDCTASVFLLIVFRRQGETLHLRLHPKRWIEHFRASLPLGTGSILAALSINFPPIAIGILMNAASVGIYTAAAKLVIFLLILDRVVSQLLVPASVRLFTNDPGRLATELQRALKWVLLLGLPTAVGGTFLAGKIIPLVYGSQFDEAVSLFQVQIWYFAVTLVHTVYTAGLIALHQERQYGRIMIVTAAMYAAGVVGGIFVAGTIGASAGVVIAELISTLIMRSTLGKTLTIAIPKGAGRIILACLVMAVILWQFPAIPLVPVILLAGSLYLLQVWITRAVNIDEVLHMVRRAS